MLTKAGYILGANAVFFREGDTFTKDIANQTVTATAASAAARPGTEDAGWIDLGIIEDADVTSEATDVERWGCKPGKLHLLDVVEVKSKLKVKLTTNEAGALAAEHLFRTSAELGGATDDFIPLSGGTKRGWLQVQMYDETNTLRVMFVGWVRLKVTGGLKAGGSDFVKPTWEADLLYSTLNAGTIS